MNGMVDVLAEALAKAHGSKWEKVPEVPEDPELDWSSRTYWRKMARAALVAMREPTEDMTEHPSYLNGEWSRRNWEAAIDAALSPEPSPT